VYFSASSRVYSYSASVPNNTSCCICYVVKMQLGLESFSVVLEDDGSSVCDDVLTALIEDGDNGEKLGTLMILSESQNWTQGL